MYYGRRVTVVIPAYNVRKQILTTLAGIPDLVDNIIVVDDASSDGTSQVLADVLDSRLMRFTHETNQGVGGAVVTGFRGALAQKAELIVKMDADGQMDPKYIPALLEPIVAGACGYTKGNRFLSTEELRSMPWLRLVGAFCLTFLCKLASGYWHVFDPVNGYVAIDVNVLRKLPLNHLARRYFFETDLLIHLNVFRVRIKDVPIPPRYGDEQSSMRLLTVLFTFPVFLLKGFWYRLYQRHVLREFSAVAVFWVFGAVMLLWGTGFGAFVWTKSIHSGHVATTGTVMLSVLPLMLGFQLALQAILIEINDSSSSPLDTVRQTAHPRRTNLSPDEFVYGNVGEDAMEVYGTSQELSS